MLGDRVGHRGFQQVLASGPGGAEQSGDDAQIGEELFGVLGGMVRVQSCQQPLLGCQEGVVGDLDALGLVEAGAAGGGRSWPTGSPRVAALGGVQGVVADAGDQTPGCGWRMALGAAVEEEHLVVRAEEADR
jgi:hypothetical protein